MDRFEKKTMMMMCRKNLFLLIFFFLSQNYYIAVHSFSISPPLSLVSSALLTSSSSSSSSRVRPPRRYYQSIYHGDINGSGDNTDEEADWRAFRAMLVMQERNMFRRDIEEEEANFLYDHYETPTITTKTTTETTTTKTTTSTASTEAAAETIKSPSSTERDDATTTTTTTTTWAYESGDTIEIGSILINAATTNPEQGMFGYGLVRQFLHKAIVLVLDHDDTTDSDVGSCLTKGIILNRPTDLILDNDNDNDDNGWNIWYGGNEGGLHTNEPIFFCLHSLTSHEALENSREVMRGLKFTSIANAQKLVSTGQASIQDFWTFSGIVSWDSNEISELVRQGVWRVVATDSQTLLQGSPISSSLENVKKNDDFMGLYAWNNLMNKIGFHTKDEITETTTATTNTKMEQQQQYQYHESLLHSRFDDLMLQEWIRRKLIFVDHDNHINIPTTTTTTKNNNNIPSSSSLLGHILCGSGHINSPFLLQDQEFYKSLILIIQDDNDYTIGLILHHVTSKSINLPLFEDSTSFFKRGNHYHHHVSIPIRYGGPYDMVQGYDTNEEDDGMVRIHDRDNIIINEGDDDENEEKEEEEESSILFLHRNPTLMKHGIGQPIGVNDNNNNNNDDNNDNDDDDNNQIWRCSADEAIKAIGRQYAMPNDFMAISGFCIWEKKNDNDLYNDIVEGHFHVLPQENNKQIWDLLQTQEQLSTMKDIDMNLNIAHQAWSSSSKKKTHQKNDEEDEFVFGTNVNVNVLGYSAVKAWVMAFLFDAMELRP